MATPKRLFLVDAFALIFRSYYAFLRNPRISSDGKNRNALYGFTQTLLELLRSEKPDFLAVVFDLPGDTFRHEMYKEYKAQRDETPEDILSSLPDIRKLLDLLNILQLGVPGYEADDLIGTLATQAESEGLLTYMVTPDKDYAQLVTPQRLLYRPNSRGGYDIWGPNEVCEKYGFDQPTQMIDYLAIVGDTSDNIPGCRGIGEKGASDLLRQFSSVDEIYRNINQLKPGIQKKLSACQSEVALSHRLATICTDVPHNYHFSDMGVHPLPHEELAALLDEWGFRSLKRRFLDEEQTSTDTGLPDLFAKASSTAPLPPLSLGKTGEYRDIRAEDDWQPVWEQLARASCFAFDCETDRLSSLHANLVGISFAMEEGKAYFLRMPSDPKAIETRLAPLAAFMQDKSKVKIAQNGKFDMKVLGRYNIPQAEPLFDTLVAHYLAYPDRPHGLESIAQELLGIEMMPYQALSPKKNFSIIDDVSPEQLAFYGAEDADMTLRLYPLLKEKLIQEDLLPLFLEVEAPLVGVLQKMEERGVRIDTARLEEVGTGMQQSIELLEEEIYQMAGIRFNINSPSQVGEVLFDKLQIDPKPKRTKSGQYATGEEILVKYAAESPIVLKILEIRAMRKLLSTYIEALPKLLFPDGKLHTTFNQTVVTTGRLSSSNPNLQNIPNRTATGREIRAAFVPADEEYLFLSADYSQIELRLLAHLSQDEGLIQAFLNGEDIHRSTAARIWHIPLQEVTPQQRSHAKTANFGIIYGISAFGLSQRLNIPRQEAAALIDSYKENYPGIDRYMQQSIASARERGYAETLLKRRRYLPDLLSHNATVRGFAERNAINTPIQGTAADLIKIAMVRIDKAIQEQGLKSRMILQVHDELCFDCHIEEQEILTQLIRREMSQALGELSVPLEVEVGIGKNWLEAH